MPSRPSCVPWLNPEICWSACTKALWLCSGRSSILGIPRNAMTDSMRKLCEPMLERPEPHRRAALCCSNSGMPCVAIVYARFGPYHVARLRGVAAVFERKGWDVVGVEVYPDDRFYAWDKLECADGPRRVDALPGRQHKECSAREVHRAVTAVLARENPDAVALPGWAFRYSMTGLRWCRRNRRTAVLMSETCRHDAERVFWKEWIKKRRVRRFDAALVGGNLHAAYVQELGMPVSRVFFGHNTVDNDYFRRQADTARRDAESVRRALGLPPRYWLASSRFVPVKNLLALLDAYRRYRAKAGEADPLPLVLCGDGPERAQIRSLAAGAETGVTLPGFVQYDALPAYYGLAAGFVHASTVEPWGLVVNEAMASGLPVLVSNRCGCAPDLVREGVNGYTFDPYNVEELAERLLELHRREADLPAMGQASREIIREWGPERFGQGLWQAIQAAEK